MAVAVVVGQVDGFVKLLSPSCVLAIISSMYSEITIGIVHALYMLRPGQYKGDLADNSLISALPIVPASRECPSQCKPRRFTRLIGILLGKEGPKRGGCGLSSGQAILDCMGDVMRCDLAPSVRPAAIE